MMDLNWTDIKSLDDINNLALNNENILEQLELKPFPENKDKDFYRKYLLTLLESRMETETKRGTAFEKVSRCKESNPRYRIYRSEFMYNLVRGNVIDKLIDKTRAVIKQKSQ